VQCCGQVPSEITSQTDPYRIFICGVCGKQGPASAFPDPEPEPMPALTRMQRVRLKIAAMLYGLSRFIAPEI
jgi:hypothetical protein